MSVVVADTSPLNYLVQTGAISVLPKLYGQVVIPQAVFDELSDPGPGIRSPVVGSAAILGRGSFPEGN